MDTQFEHAYVLNVMADDHPGIVAAVSGALARLGGNIDSCSQTVLEGYFTLILIVSFPEEVDPAALAREVSGSKGTGFQVVARPFDASVATRAAGETEGFVLTAFGRDRPGIIAHLTQYLAGRDINLTDLYWDRKGGEFVMISQLDLPRRLDLAMLQADLEQMGAEDGYTVRLQHENVFVATNQLRPVPPPKRQG